ncbi:MAG: nucleotidyltransferase domain-containing protein [Chloroflexota bacterium]|nr:nucleotidyltransferase domain-containing protein [Chloroflexota bacterium]
MDVDISPVHFNTLASILAQQVPDCEVRAFGSRVKGTARKYSDLDLVVVGKGPLDLSRYSKLTTALEESSLPFNVDVLDWHSIPETFRQGIERQYIVLQQTGM